MKLVRLTNYDDWEAFYLKDENGKWDCKAQGHHVQVDELVKMLGVDLEEIDFDFESTGAHAPYNFTDDDLETFTEMNNDSRVATFYG